MRRPDISHFLAALKAALSKPVRVNTRGCAPRSRRRGALAPRNGPKLMETAVIVRHASLAAAVAAAASLAAPASAAPDNLHRFVSCLAESRPAQVRQLLGATSAASASLSYHALADDNRCFMRVYPNGEFRPQDVAFSQDLLRGRLAEQALLARSEAVGHLQPLPLQQKRYLRSWFVTTGRNPAVDEMGACMADTDPAAIAALIKTDPGSSDEAVTFGTMSASLTRCLSAGTRLDAGRQALRAALADALYQRLNNPSLSLAGTPH